MKVIRWSIYCCVIICLFFLFNYKSMLFQMQNSSMSNMITIGFVGDVMIGRLVNQIISQKGYVYIWGNMRSKLAELDYTIANLETTLTTSTKIVPKVFNFKADPDKVNALVEGHISLVNLANNHSLDFSDEGLLETISVLDNAGIAHVGAGQNATEAAQSAIIEKNGIRIGVIGFADYPLEWKAKEDTPGINYVTLRDIEKVENDIKNIRSKVDFLIATIHWGPNMCNRPSSEFVDFAHAMIDAGIDIIHGHSAHVVQAIEIYKDKLIMYDTGDFIDDYAVDPELRNDLSFLFQVTLNKKGLAYISLLPVKIDHMQVNTAQGKDYKFIVDRMKELCTEFGTKIIERQGFLKITF